MSQTQYKTRYLIIVLVLLFLLIFVDRYRNARYKQGLAEKVKHRALEHDASEKNPNDLINRE